MYIHARPVCPKSGRNKLVAAIASALVALPLVIPSDGYSADTNAAFPADGIREISATSNKGGGTSSSIADQIKKEKYKRLPEFSTERWALFVTDPNWSTLSGKADYGSLSEPTYKNSKLSITAKESNMAGENESKRFSIFGAYYDGDNKNGTKDGTDGLKRQTPTEDKRELLSKYFSQRTLSLTLEPGKKPYTLYVSDVFGANNDFAGRAVSNTATPKDSDFVKANNNSVLINLENNTLNFKRIKGGKGVSWRELTGSNNLKPITQASYNLVVIKGAENSQNQINLIGVYDQQAEGGTASIKAVDREFYLNPSIFGGDALQADHNIVFLKNVNTDGIARKFGIVGGRAQDGTAVNGSTSVGADSRNNLVLIQNSIIGVDGEKSEGTNVYGGLGYASAQNNTVVIDNTKILGNVSGGLSFLDNVMFDKNSYHKFVYGSNTSSDSFNADQVLRAFNIGLTEDHNSVYLNQAVLEGTSAVYASSGGLIKKTDGNPSEYISFVDSKLVNLRRGTVYLNGANRASSIYADTVYFGKVFDASGIDLTATSDSSGKKLLTDSYTEANPLTVTFGHSLSESYIRTSAGFHSTLTRLNEDQSDITHGKHNYWTNVVVNLGNITTINGDGKHLDTTVPVFEKKERDGNSYVEAKDTVFSLLAQDNVGGSSTFLAISSGYHTDSDGKILDNTPVRALNLNWSRILEYRLSYASGGRYSKDENKELKPIVGQVAPSYSNAAVPLPQLQVFRGGENIFSPSETYVWVDDDKNWYEDAEHQNLITDKIAFLKKVQTQTAESPEINKVNIQQNGKNVATAQYVLLPYLSVGELYEVKEEDTDGRVKNFKGHIFSLTPLLKTDADLFVSKNNVDGTTNIFKGNFDETQLYYRDEDGNFYEEVASAGDIVSVTNLSGTSAEAGGLALGSRLMKLELLDQVVLNGLTEDQTDISTDSYTAEMELTGNGGIYIPASNTVFIGGEDKQNSFSGKTEVGASGKLSLVATEALGNTESVVLGSAATLTISKRTDSSEDNPTYTSQTIKNISGTDDKTSLIIEEGNSLKLLGSTEEGQIGIVSGAGKLSIENANFEILASGTFSGPTNLTGSTLKLNKADSLGTSAVTFAANSKVMFESPNGTSGNTFQGAGSLLVNGGKSLILAGTYTDSTETFTGGLTLENTTVSTDKDSNYGWKRVGSGDIALNGTSSLTVYYSNVQETTGASFKNKILSGSGTLSLINSGTNQDSFEFGSKNGSGIFTGTLALNNVGISLNDKNATAMAKASLELGDKSTAIVTQKFETTEKVTFLAGATLDFSSVETHLGAKEISNTITATKGFDFSNSPQGKIKVNLSGKVGTGDASLGLPLLDQDNGPVKLYFGFGNVTGSLANIKLVNADGTDLDLGSQKFDYKDGTAELTYSWGLTADTSSSPLFGTSEGFGLGYKLTTVNVNDGKTLVLGPVENGLDSTLSAKLTSNEGSGSKVEIHGDLIFDNRDNNFDSALILTSKSALTAVAGALGQKYGLFASEVSLEEASTLTLKDGSHTIGSLNTDSSSKVVMDAAAGLTIRGDSTVEGTLTGGKNLNFEGKEGSVLNVTISSSNDQFRAPVSLEYTSLTLGKVSSLGSSLIKLDQNSTVQYSGPNSWSSSNIFEGSGSIVYEAQNSKANIFTFKEKQGEFSGTLELQQAHIELSDKQEQKQNVTALQNATLKLVNNSSALVIGDRELFKLEMSSGSVLKLGKVDLVNQKAAGSLQVNELGTINGQISLDRFTADINGEWSKLLDLDETAYITLVSGPKDTSTPNPQFTYSVANAEKKLELAKGVEGTFDIDYTNTKDNEIGAFVTSILTLLDVQEDKTVTFEKGIGSQGDDFSAGILGKGTIIITDNLIFNANEGATKFEGILKVNPDSSLTLENAQGLGTQDSHVSVIENSGTINIAEQTYVDRIFGKGNWQLTKGSSSSLHLVNAGGSIGNWSEGTSSWIQGSLGGEGNILIDAGALRIESSNKDLKGKLDIGSQKTKAEVILTKTDSIGAMDIEIAEESRLTLEGLNENFDNNLKSNNGNILVTSKSDLKINNSDKFHGSYEINNGSTLSFGKLAGFANAKNVSANVEKGSSLLLKYDEEWELKNVISGGGTIVIGAGNTAHRIMFTTDVAQTMGEQFYGDIHVENAYVDLTANAQAALTRGSLVLDKNGKALIQVPSSDTPYKIGGLSFNGGTLDASNAIVTPGKADAKTLLNISGYLESGDKTGTHELKLSGTGKIQVGLSESAVNSQDSYYEAIKDFSLLDQDEGTLNGVLHAKIVGLYNEDTWKNTSLVVGDLDKNKLVSEFFDESGNARQIEDSTHKLYSGDQEDQNQIGTGHYNFSLSAFTSEQSAEKAGIYVGYGLVGVEIKGGKTLTLTPGRLAGGDTFSAWIKDEAGSSGNLVIAKGQQEGNIIRLQNSANAYTGTTTVTQGMKLVAATDSALGKTSELILDAGSSYEQAAGTTQTIGKLNQFAGQSSVFVDKNAILTLAKGGLSNGHNALTGTGTLKVESETLQVSHSNAGLTGNVEIANDASVLALSSQSLGSSDVTLEEQGGLTFKDITDGSSVSNTFHGDGSINLSKSDIKFSKSSTGFTGTIVLDSPSHLAVEKLDALGASEIKNEGTLHLNLDADEGWNEVALVTRSAGSRKLTGSGNVIKTGKGVLTLHSNYASEGTTTIEQGGALSGTAEDPLNLAASFDVRKGAYLQAFGSINNLTNAGTVYLNGIDAKKTTESKLTVNGDFVGEGGTLVFDADLASDTNSHQNTLLVKGNATGNGFIRVNNLDGKGAQTQEGITLVSIEGDSNVSFLLDGAAKAGAYDYLLMNSADNKRWYLNSVNRRVRSEAGTYIGLALAAEQMNMRLHDRMGQAYVVDPQSGELRQAAGWVRQLASHSRFSTEGEKTRLSTSVTQLGMDALRFKPSAETNAVAGFYAGGLYGKSKTRAASFSKGKIDGFAFGVYGTFYTGSDADDGFYTDTWLQYGRYDNRITGEDPELKFRSHGFTFSVETGYSFKLAKTGAQKETDFIIQPQAQLIVTDLKNNSVSDTHGYKFKQLGKNNATVRLGARFMVKQDTKLTAFVEGNWLHNMKKAGVQMGTEGVYMSGGKNTGEIRVGAEGSLSRNLKGWVSGSFRAGQSGYHTESAQVGLKLLF